MNHHTNLTKSHTSDNEESSRIMLLFLYKLCLQRKREVM